MLTKNKLYDMGFIGVFLLLMEIPFAFMILMTLLGLVEELNYNNKDLNEFYEMLGDYYVDLNTKQDLLKRYNLTNQDVLRKVKKREEIQVADHTNKNNYIINNKIDDPKRIEKLQKNINQAINLGLIKKTI